MSDYQWISHPPAGWRVGVGPRPASLIEEILSCQQVWAWLSRAQRAAILAADGGRVTAHTLTMRNLRKRGLIGDDDRLTEVGALIWKWNKPRSTSPKEST